MSGTTTDLEVGLWLSTSLRKIPPISPLAGKLVSLSLESDDATVQLEKIVTSDPALSARILGLANSALFASSGKQCLAVREALLRLGLQQAWQTACAFTFGRAVTIDPELRQAKELLWLHSYATGAFARELAAASDVPSASAELAFLGGFLHDIGYLAIIALEPLIVRKLMDVSLKRGHSYRNLETRLGLPDHATIGGALCELWGLPEEVRELVALHQSDDPIEETTGKPATLVAMILGHRVASELIEGIPSVKNVQGPSNEQLCADLGITAPRFAQIFDSLSSRLETVVGVGRAVGA